MVFTGMDLIVSDTGNMAFSGLDKKLSSAKMETGIIKR
jgi:hypothetical protein